MSGELIGAVVGFMLGLQVPGLYKDWMKAKYGQRCIWCDREITPKISIDTQVGLRRAYFDSADCWIAWERNREGAA